MVFKFSFVVDYEYLSFHTEFTERWTFSFVGRFNPTTKGSVVVNYINNPVRGQLLDP